MTAITLIATTAFGLEKVVKNEVRALGFDMVRVQEGRVEFDATLADIPRANLWLRSADRVLLKMGAFPARTFDELFEGVRALPWENWITKEGEFIVLGKGVRSQLGSFRAIQSITKKAVAERLKDAYRSNWLDETGPRFTVRASVLKDVATLTLDTSGEGLHKRGYRAHTGIAPLKETLAAALVQLSFWQPQRLLIDPMCGSGTILIEAAMIGRNIAPGLRREFVSEAWPVIPAAAWRLAREQARAAILPGQNLRIFGYDIDEEAIAGARLNAKRAGVGKSIIFQQKDVRDLWIDQQYGIVISNFPYGIKLLDYKELNDIYISFNKTFKKKKGWSVYVLTADKIFPKYFKRGWPDRVRKLFNANIEVNYYQYYGQRPPQTPQQERKA
jgi:putative N6-adenine-specific DNA methylase